MVNRNQLTNYEENHCLRYTEHLTNYEIRTLYPVIAVLIRDVSPLWTLTTARRNMVPFIRVANTQPSITSLTR
jgi:hypothetical protein